MKVHLLALLAVVFAQTVTAAMAPKEFAGIPWGASISEVKAAMSAKGASFQERESGGDRLVFNGGSFGGETAEQWHFSFRNGKFAGARVRLAPNGRGEDQFRKMKQALSEKYGTASDKQVAHRRADHFVLGAGWLASGADKAPLTAKWSAESALDKREVEIRCWLDGRVRISYEADSPELEDSSSGKKEL